MNWQHFLTLLETIKWIFIAQFSFIGLHILFLLLVSPLSKFFLERKEKKIGLKKEKFYQLIEDQHQWSESLLPSSLRTISILIPLILEIDQKKSDNPLWNSMRESLFKEILFPQAKKQAYSKNWVKRAQAIGCFIHCLDLKNESEILHLIHDPVPIVQYSAADCGAKLGTDQLVNTIIDAMNCDRFLRHPFREALSKGDPQVFNHIENRLERDKDPYVKVSCLEVLALHMDARRAKLAERDLYSEHKNLRIAAIRSLGHYFDQKSISLLIPLLKDPEWEIRAISARCLGYLKAQEALSELALLLKDTAWWVRLNSALALKRLGESGVRILEQQNPKEDQFAYEIAQYVLKVDLYE